MAWSTSALNCQFRKALLRFSAQHAAARSRKTTPNRWLIDRSQNVEVKNCIKVFCRRRTFISIRHGNIAKCIFEFVVSFSGKTTEITIGELKNCVAFVVAAECGALHGNFSGSNGIFIVEVWWILAKCLRGHSKLYKWKIWLSLLPRIITKRKQT